MKSGSFPVAAFVDLICCAFGAAILLFLIAICLPPEQQVIERKDFMIVFCSHISGDRAEVGVEYQRPGSATWLPFTHDRSATEAGLAEGFSSPASLSSGASAFVLLRNPEPGLWRFRTLLVNFPVTQSKDISPIEVQMIARGDTVSPSYSAPLVSRLHKPGDVGDILDVRVIAPRRF